MLDFEIIRDFTEDHIMILKVGRIDADLLGQYAALQDVIITVGQDLLWFVPEIYVNQNLYVKADKVHPLLMHDVTGEVKVDDSETITLESNHLEALIYAVLIYFHDNAKGISQKAFYRVISEKVEKNLYSRA
jgi:hypothetical protein